MKMFCKPRLHLLGRIALLFLTFLLGHTASAQLSVPFQPRLPGGNIKVKGDLVYVANNIVSISSDPNSNYNGSASNQDVNIGYIDIDGDPSTFSSSSAELNAPSCSHVVYAGLYWGGIYRDSNRNQPYKSVKFKIPGGSYIDIGPSSGPEFKYEQIYDKDGDRDGDGNTDPGVVDVDYLSGQNMTSYLNYADVTHILSALPDPNGAYTVANIVASTNQKNVSAGWTLVVIYENLNSPSRYISTFDGYAAMGSTYPSVDFSFSGFKTLPAPLPVVAHLGASTIDGDRITGPSMKFRAKPTDSWTSLSNSINPANNVFNSTISNLGSWVDTRTPASHNTLGWDADILNLSNSGNSVLPNDHTSGEIQISTSSEGVILFLTTMAVDIIDPEILVEKKVEDLAGNDITGAGVNLGQSLEYVLRFWNRGNDDAEDFSIKDVLPDNVSLESVDLSQAPGTNMTTNPSDPQELTFEVPNGLVKENSNIYEIRIKVKVSSDCHDFVAACSNTIHNTAFSTYTGKTSGQVNTDDPSVSNVSACGLITTGATNFLLDDLTNCSFNSEVQLCGANALLTAGSGYDTYTWYKDVNGNQQLDPSDTEYYDSDPDSNPATTLVTEAGYYLVKKESASCGTNVESIHVTRFGSTQTNPILTFFNTVNGDADPSNDIQGEVVTCPNDGSLLPRLFLCGANDSRTINLNITDTQSIAWQKLDENSCAANNPDCPNNQMGCTWNQVGTGNSFNANNEGRYRVVLSYAGGCSSIFYFDVYQNNLNFNVVDQDIFCATDGFIRIDNVGSGYGFRLLDISNGTEAIPYSAHNGSNFTITTAGIYEVTFAAIDPNTGNPYPNSCEFSSGQIGISLEELSLNLITKPVTCLGQGSVRVQAQHARANYSYKLYTDDGTGNPGSLLAQNPTESSSDYTFSGLNAGNYVVVVGTDDGCLETQAFTIDEIPNPQVSATTTKQISCTNGTVALTATDGFPNPDYLFAIWSKDGVEPYTSIGQIPSTEFQRDTIAPGVFDFSPGQEGTYRFVVVDGNNCYSISNQVTVQNLGALTMAAPTIDAPIKCEGSATGEITANYSGGQAPYSFSINNWASQQNSPNFANLSPGTYTVQVRDADGCEDQITVTLDDPETFKANAGVSKTGTCDPNEFSEVRFTNVEGGIQPYEFSFDGGTTFVVDDPMDPTKRIQLLPSGNHVLIARDARGCQIVLPITIAPPPPITVFDFGVDYNCDGSGNVSFTTNQNIYDYTYTINTMPSTTVTDGNFTGIAPGNYMVTAEYAESDPPNPSILLHEDFGSGPTISSPYTLGYGYEDQAGSDTYINDFEYSITNYILTPFYPWLRPQDHTSNGADTNGRYLVINVGSPAPGQIIYKKPIKDIVPNQPVRVSFAAINLLSLGNQLDPDLYIQMRIPGTTTVVGEVRTNDIPKNLQWNTFEFTMDPGNNTELDFVLISKKIGNDGNDVAIDDIEVEQIPQSCSRTQTIPVVIEAGKDFRAQIIGHTNITCNGANDGSISFELENFDATAGFEYSVDGGTTWILATTSPVTTAANLPGGNQTVLVRKADDTGCSITLNQLLDEPAPLALTATVDQTPSCIDPSGIIKATVTGGTPNYEYALEDGVGNTLVPFPNPSGATFGGLVPGDYVVLVKDLNGCNVASSTITLNAPTAPTFTATPSTCYDGSNNASIHVVANTGNGDYLFQINGGPWQSPNVATPTEFTFGGLTNGTYNINVKDALGCSEGVKTVTIAPALETAITKTDVNSCVDGSIVATSTGGTGTLVYALVPANTVPAPTDFVASNTFAVTDALAQANPAGFDLYVRDNNGAAPYCEHVEEDILVRPAVHWEITATPEDPDCNGGFGTLLAHIQKNGGGALTASETSQIGPFTYALYQGATQVASVSNLGLTDHTFTNLPAGTYELRVTSGTGCSHTLNTINIVDPPVLTAEVETIFDPLAPCTPAVGFQFINYPSPALLHGTLEFSHDNGTTWRASDLFDDLSLTSGDVIHPSIRTIDGSGNTLCRYDLPTYTLHYPLDDLNINLSAVVVGCNELQVTAQGTAGNAPYTYTYTEDPANFDPYDAASVWLPTTPTAGSHTFTGLVPGRTYVFFVQDANGCVRQSSKDVNEIPGVNLPIDVVDTTIPSCAGANNGSISFAINPDTPQPQMRWEFYQMGNATPIEVSGGGASAVNVSFTNTLNFAGLAAGNYYLQIIQVDGGGADACIGGSENIEIKEQLPVTAGSATEMRPISCSQPGLIQVTNINGGTGPYTFTVNGPAGFTSIVGTNQNPIEIPSNSPAGNYDITVTDVYGCATSAPVTVAMSLTPNPTIDDIQVSNCNGPASVNVTASSAAGQLRYAMVVAGAAAPTSYLVNNGDFQNVAPDTYDVYVIDANGCPVVYPDLVVAPSLQASAQLTKVLDCSATPDATISIEALQGSGTYSYSVENLTTSTPEVGKTSMGGNSVLFNAATAGDYEIKVYVDATATTEACERTFTVTVPAKISPSFTLTKTDVSCNGSQDGSISMAQTDNGITPLTYTLLDSSLSPIPATNYTYDPASRTFTGLAPGDYIVRGTGTNSCHTDSAIVTIGEPTPINVTIPAANIVQFGCGSGNNPDNASITVDTSAAGISGGSGNYVRYQFVDAAANVVQDGNNPSLIVTDYSGGTYTINVYDDAGCMGSCTATIDPFDVLQSASVTVTDEIACNNAGETIQIVATGSLSSSTDATHNFSFEEVATGTTNTTGIFTDLAVGSHSFMVSNTATGCAITVTHNVSEIEKMIMDVITDQKVICAGSDSQNHLEITGYSGSFVFTAYNTNGTLSNDSDDTTETNGNGTGGSSLSFNLPKGTFRIEVQQGSFPFCTQTTYVTIDGADQPITAVIAEVGNASCGNDQGRLSVRPAGGIAPYTIAIPSLGLSQNNVYSFEFGGLQDGNYDVVVTDAAGCTETFYGNNIHTVMPLTASISPDQTLDCIGYADGVVTATLTSGGEGTVWYSLQTMEADGVTVKTTGSRQTTATFAGLKAGIYRVVVDDEAGCSYTTTNTAILNPSPVVAQLALSTPASCLQDAGLTLSVVSGGTPFPGGVYQWSESRTSGFVDMLNGTSQPITKPAGTYTFYVRDAKGCEPVETHITIEPVAPLTVTVSQSASGVNCNGDATASITAKAAGGVGQYQYSLYLGSTANPALLTNTSGIFTNLGAGNYYVGITSGSDCEVISNVVNITQPPTLSAVAVVEDALCHDDTNGSITVNVSGGTPGYQYAISPQLNKFVSQNTFTNMAPGTYTIIVQDANGCFEILEETVGRPDALEVTPTTADEICYGNADGMVSLAIQGGTAPYWTSLDSNADSDFVQGRLSYSDLTAGNHVVFVKDANGCTTNVIISIATGANLDADVSVEYECGGTMATNYLNIQMQDPSVAPDLLYGLDTTDPNAMVLSPDFSHMAPGHHVLTIAHANGCSRDYEFDVRAFEPLTLQLANPGINEISAQAMGGNPDYTYQFSGGAPTSTSSFMIHQTGTYSVTVTDENGCSITQDIYLEFIDIDIPTFFTPDGDGINDLWKPKNIEVFPNIVMTIFDRYGREVYKMLQNTDGWDGFYNDANLPAGDYWYIIKLNGEDDAREFVGHFNLYR